MKRILLGGALAALACTSPLTAQLPDVGGGVYLFHYRPVDLDGAESHTELYAAYATADVARGRWRVHGELRGRDTRLRPFFERRVWLQQGWVAFDAMPREDASALTLRAGKVYQTFGRFWDGSFYGNIHYFDGLKLNPQWGAEAAGALGLGDVTLGYSAQYLLASDRVSGALLSRDFETLDGFEDRHGWTIRGTLGLPQGLTVGATAAARGIRATEAARAAETHHVPHIGADAEWRRGPVTVYSEWLRRGAGGLPDPLARSVAGSEATYWLVGAQLDRGRVHLRYNYSGGSYDAIGRREWIHQPGVTLDLNAYARVLVEGNFWSADSDEGPATLDRSLNLILNLGF